MTTEYDEARQMAHEELMESGAQITLRKISEGEYIPGEELTPTYTESVGYAFRRNYRINDVDGTNIQMGDVLFLVGPYTTDGGLLPSAVAGDLVVFGGETLRVIMCERGNYDGTDVFFRIQARK